MTTPRKGSFYPQENVSLQTNRLVPGVNVKKESNAKYGSLPKAPRSPFICFTDSKKHEIMARHGFSEESPELLNTVAKEWKSLSKADRAYWDEESRNDKVRFVTEKSEYKGPMVLPKRRAKKHPLAPKRPMSAFLKYSKKRRQYVKANNPDMNNTDVSRLLGEMWRNASDAEKGPYKAEELKEREVYKKAIATFREEQAKKDAASRTSHKTVRKMSGDYQQYQHQYQQYEQQHQHYQQHQPSARSAYDAPARSSGFKATNAAGLEAPPLHLHHRRHETVEDMAGKADQRMVFSHSFGGAPFSSYRPHYEMPRQHPGHVYQPQSNPADYHQQPQVDRQMPATNRSFASVQLEDDDDLLYPTNNGTTFFSDNMGFNFYNNNGYL